MSQSPTQIDLKRRRFLGRATATAGAAAAVCAAVPFVSSMLPSAAAIASGAPVKVNLADLKPGEQRTVEWRKRPIWIIKRTTAMLQQLAQHTSELRDPNSSVAQQPQYIDTPWRSLKPDYLILVGICTHLGCSPTYRPDHDGVEQGWPGGFFCSCHGSKFDMAGRVYQGVPAPINLEVPPHTFISEHELMIGQDPTPAQLQAIAVSATVKEFFA